MTDPFDALAMPDEELAPRASFARDLRMRIESALGVAPIDQPTIDLPPRRPTMHTDTTTAPAIDRPTEHRTAATSVTPYLAVHDAAAALDFYAAAFDAVEEMRVEGDDGRIGHAEFTIDRVTFYLADEFPDLGVVSPVTLGGSGVTMHLAVDDVDAAFASAVAAGAESLQEPGDQPHGARHGTLRDPFGHRWMLSQEIEVVSTDEYAQRMTDSEWSVTAPAAGVPDSGNGGIWSAVGSDDAPALIRFLVDVVGFTEQIVVPGDVAGTVVHSQLRWPEGGIVQVSTAGREHNVFSDRPVGSESLYVITADPETVLERCVAAGVEVVAPMAAPDYDPTGSMFSIRDFEGNLWSFGTYAGEL